MICSHCNGTGDLHGMGHYDCSNCGVADERTALDAAMALLPPMIKEDIHWAAYNAGVLMAEKRFALERAELVRQLRAMWGWAIELDANCIKGQYFDEGSEEGLQAIEDWRADTRQVLALLQAYGDKKG